MLSATKQQHLVPFVRVIGAIYAETTKYKKSVWVRRAPSERGVRTERIVTAYDYLLRSRCLLLSELLHHDELFLHQHRPAAFVRRGQPIIDWVAHRVLRRVATQLDETQRHRDGHHLD